MAVTATPVTDVRHRSTRTPPLVIGDRSMATRTLTVDQKKSIFLALATAQEVDKLSVAESKKQVAEQFEISRDILDSIEREGVDKDWPPLDDA